MEKEKENQWSRSRKRREQSSNSVEEQHACSTENHLQRGVTAYHPETAIPVIVHPRTTSTDGSVDSGLWPRRPLSTSGQVFLNYDR